MANEHNEKILIINSNSQVNFLLERVLTSTGYQVLVTTDLEMARKELNSFPPPTLIVLSDILPGENCLDFASEVLDKYSGLPVVLLVTNNSTDLLKKSLVVGISDYLTMPLRTEEILKSIQTSLHKSHQRRDWVLKESRRNTATLQARVDEMETLAHLARTVTGSLNVDDVLTNVVEAAVKLTGAEEGSLLLVDETTGELYMRAGKNFQEDFVHTFRLQIQDSLAGTVLRTGKPVVVDEKTPRKIKTSYLVHSLVYVPLQIHGHVFGVLGVDNRVQNRTLQERDEKMLAALAEYAVIAIQNANLYQNLAQERNKLETILTQIEDGVIVLDFDQRLVLVNQTAQNAFNLSGRILTGMQFTDVFSRPELLELVHSRTNQTPGQTEFATEDGRMFSALLADIPNLGTAITFHDISHLKRLDRIKSDFVNTVSHDLRSPLTAILGYVELIERTGSINDTQKEFIQRVQSSVQNITTLVNDLLNLGRIEAGFDTRKENIAIGQLIKYTLDSYRKRIEAKNQILSLNLQDDLPSILAYPVQMRQMFENLIENSIKYTPEGGKITVKAAVSQSQLVLQVSDTGIGIPSIDLPYIFDKFYRASNVSNDSGGTGLGLSIVKSIVESHNGRIWVDSTPGIGATFTVVLPLS